MEENKKNESKAVDVNKKANKPADVNKKNSKPEDVNTKDNRAKEIARILKFAIFSASAGAIELLTFTLLTELTPLSYWPRYLTALIISVLWNFTLNRNFTFKSASNVPKAMLLVGLFYAVFTPTTTILGHYLAEDLGWNDYMVTCLNMGLNITTEYLYDRFVVFRNSIDTNKMAEAEKEKEKRKAESAEARETKKKTK